MWKSLKKEKLPLRCRYANVSALCVLYFFECTLLTKFHCFVARPLNLFDNFEAVGGIPTVCLKLGDKARDKYIKYALSEDGSRMAINASNGTVK